MDREIDVFLSCGTRDVPVGRLWTRTRSGRASSSFEYTPTWLSDPAAFELAPDLPLHSGAFHTQQAMWNAFSDAAPDRWGRTLALRHERARTRHAGTAPRTLHETDFLLEVADFARPGALRFCVSGASVFAAEGGRIPPLIELPRLLRATDAVLADRERDEDLALLLAPGSSLGGARPKASVLAPDGSLWVAKFPSRDDDWPTTRWEAVELRLASWAGIRVAESDWMTVSRRPVLLLRRFDRQGDSRLATMSALTALGARGGELRSYLELADTIRARCAAARSELRELWRRLAFNILTSNTDDHLRNHLFLLREGEWALSPAFDLNPMPVDVRPRVHAMAIDESDPTSSVDTALRIAPSFGLTSGGAREILSEVAHATVRWREAAAIAGLTPGQVERMESAFEHGDAKLARGG